MLQAFMMKKMLRKHLEHLPNEQQEKIERVIEKNPELFIEIAKEVQSEMAKGKDQITALAAIAEKHKDRLKGLL